MLPRLACEICRATERQPYLESQPLKYVKCSACAFVYADPIFEPQALDELYSEEYFVKNRNDEKEFEYRRWLSGEVVGILEEVSGQRGHLLELGPATGFLLVAARERGWSVSGVELSGYAARVARDVHGLDVRTGSLTDCEVPEASIDAVVALHCLEHVTELSRTVDCVARLLVPGGLFLVEVPNASSGAALRERERWQHLHAHEHLYQFTPETLKALMDRHGFAPVREMTHGMLAVSAGVARFDRFGLIPLIRRNMRYFRWLRSLFVSIRGAARGNDDFLRIVFRKKASVTAR